MAVGLHPIDVPALEHTVAGGESIAVAIAAAAPGDTILLGDSVYQFSLVIGLFMGFVTLGVGLWAEATDRP